mgnify:CR=1 FL=1
MGKNQHVTPHKDGGWQVKGQRFVQRRKQRLLNVQEKLRVDKNRNFSFMEEMEEYEREIHMVMIRFHQKDKIEIHIIKNGLKKL